MSWKFKVVPLTYTTDRDAWTLTLNNAEIARKPAFRGVECGADRRAAWTQWERRVQGAAEHMLRTVTAADARLHSR